MAGIIQAYKGFRNGISFALYRCSVPSGIVFDNPKIHDTDTVIRIAVNALKKLIE